MGAAEMLPYFYSKTFQFFINWKVLRHKNCQNRGVLESFTTHFGSFIALILTHFGSFDSFHELTTNPPRIIRLSIRLYRYLCTVDIDRITKLFLL